MNRFSLIVALLASQVCLGAPITETELHDVLNSPEAIDWSPYTSTDSDARETRSRIETLAASSDAISGDRRRAFEEIGRIGLDPDGEVYDDVLSFFTTWATAPIREPLDFAIRLAVMRGLRNLNCPEALALLEKSLDAQNSEISDFALRMLDQLVAPLEANAPAQDGPGPHFGFPLDVRPRSNEWIEAAKKLSDRLEGLERGSSTPGKIRRNSQTLRKVVDQAIKTAKSNILETQRRIKEREAILRTESTNSEVSPLPTASALIRVEAEGPEINLSADRPMASRLSTWLVLAASIIAIVWLIKVVRS